MDLKNSNARNVKDAFISYMTRPDLGLPSNRRMIAVVIALHTAWQTGTGCFMSLKTLGACAGVVNKRTVRECVAQLVEDNLIEQHDISDVHGDWFHRPCGKTQGYFYQIKLEGYPHYDVTRPMPAKVRMILGLSDKETPQNRKGGNFAPDNTSSNEQGLNKGGNFAPLVEQEGGAVLQGAILPPAKLPPDQESFNQENSYQEKGEEEVVDGAIDADIENVHQLPPPHADLILEVGTPLAAREGSLPPETEHDTPDDTGEDSREKMRSWVKGKLLQFGRGIDDEAAVTPLRVSSIMDALESACADAEYRTQCEWLKQRLTNFGGRTYEDKGPNPPHSVHQALEWLEEELREGSLARFHETKIKEHREFTHHSETRPASECHHDQDVILEPRFGLGDEEVSQ